MSTGDLDAMQKQYRDQLNALDYDDMMLNNNNRNRQQQEMMDGTTTISPSLHNKLIHTPPARPNSTPPGRNMYHDMDRQTELMMNQFGGFGLNEDVRKQATVILSIYNLYDLI
jgi:hypothetical protein